MTERLPHPLEVRLPEARTVLLQKLHIRDTFEFEGRLFQIVDAPALLPPTASVLVVDLLDANVVTKSVSLPVTPVDCVVARKADYDEDRKLANELRQLLKSMGGLTYQEAAYAIQQHAPWNGKGGCAS